MSGGNRCHCEESTKPLLERDWIILEYKGNHSAFNGYHWTASDWSSLCCNGCGTTWRTKAKYVDELYNKK